jgi:hypothetical protein
LLSNVAVQQIFSQFAKPDVGHFKNLYFFFKKKINILAKKIYVAPADGAKLANKIYGMTDFKFAMNLCSETRKINK